MPQIIETLDELLSRANIVQFRKVVRAVKLSSAKLTVDWPAGSERQFTTATIVLLDGSTHQFQTAAFKLDNLGISVQVGEFGIEKTFEDVVLLISDEGEEYVILEPDSVDESFRYITDIVPDTYELSRLNEFASAFRDAYASINDMQPSSSEMQIAIREWANPRSIPVELLFKKAPEQPVDGEQQ